MYLVAPFSVVAVSFGDINLFIDFFEIVYNLPKPWLGDYDYILNRRSGRQQTGRCCSFSLFCLKKRTAVLLVRMGDFLLFMCLTVNGGFCINYVLTTSKRYTLGFNFRFQS